MKPGDTLSIIPSVAGGVGDRGSAAGVARPSDEIKRYSRHLILPEVGMEGQKKLKAARVLCIGAGGLGSPVAMYLAAAGVGTIGIVDFDVVDFSNLQRQILHGTPDVGRPEAAVGDRPPAGAQPARDRSRLYETALTSENALELFKDYDVIVDGTDNFPTRYLVNDACVLLGKPNVYGSIFRFEGQASVFGTKEGPCYRCLYPEPPPPGLVPSCAEGGVLGVLPGIVGCIQATETFKLILGIGEPLIGRFLVFDALRMKFRELKLRKDPDCPVCGTHPTVTELIDYEQFCGVSPAPAGGGRARRWQRDRDQRHRAEGTHAIAARTSFVLDVREPHEYEINRIAGLDADSAGRAAGALLGTRRRPRDRLRSASPACAARRPPASCASTGSRTSRTSRAASLAWVDQVDPTQPKY